MFRPCPVLASYNLYNATQFHTALYDAEFKYRISYKAVISLQATSQLGQRVLIRVTRPISLATDTLPDTLLTVAAIRVRSGTQNTRNLNFSTILTMFAPLQVTVIADNSRILYWGESIWSNESAVILTVFNDRKCRTK